MPQTETSDQAAAAAQEPKGKPPRLGELRAEVSRLGITEENCQTTIDDLIARARIADDPFAYLATFAPTGEQESGVGDQEPSPEISTEPELQAADIFEADRWYPADRIASDLGIARSTIVAAHHAGKFGQYKGEHEDLCLFAADVLRWITRERIHYQVSEYAKKLHARLHLADAKRREAEAAAAPAPPTRGGLLGQVGELQERGRAESAEAGRQAIASYLKILARFDDPAPGDAHDLLGLIEDGVIVEGQVTRDLEVLRKVGGLRAEHDRRGERSADMRRCREAFEQMKRRHKQDHDEAWRQLRLAEHEVGQANAAAQNARMLTRQAPILFADVSGADFPRLRPELCEPEPPRAA